MSVVYHKPVLWLEILDSLPLSEGNSGIIADCTLGEGGHTELFLKKFPELSVLAFERDPIILERAKNRLRNFSGRVKFFNDVFSNMSNYLSGYEDSISAFVFDYGISSYHFDGDNRGFSFRDNNQPLDMRLDENCKFDAADVVNNFKENEIADIIWKFGEDRLSRRIAKAICEKRNSMRIATTADLEDIVYKAYPKGYKGVHPATRTFQALRIFVNSELDHIDKAINSSLDYLKSGGRIFSISFHSLEDRIVKNSFRELSRGCICGNSRHCSCGILPRVKIITKKPVLPTVDELDDNIRARSAKLRICEKL